MASLEDLTPEQQDQALKLFTFTQNNPDVAKAVRRMAKEKNPSMQAPDLDLEDRIEAVRKETAAEISKDRDERLAFIQQQQRREAHQRIKDAGLDPEKVEKIMVDESIGSYDTAIKYAQAQRQLAPTTPELRTALRMPDTKDLWADKNSWAKNEAFEAINELKAKRLG